MNRTTCWPLHALVAAAIVTLASPALHATDPRAYAVELSASIQIAAPQITLQWTADSNATGYSIYRKAPAATTWTAVTHLAASALTWTDSSVVNGGTYEYAVNKSTSAGYEGTGYILTGINAPVIESRGTLILIVDNTFTTSLAAELGQLQEDLVGDGWTVIRHDVSRTDTVVSVKNLIQADYSADPGNVTAVFLFGHVPVPYSGDNNPHPDGHPEHQGAWPADAYYGDMHGTWTDTTVYNTSGTANPLNQNVPGDGKFDQTDLPANVDLQVGRVDLSNMTCFSNKTPARSELDLLRAYLTKDHNFRVGAIAVPRRGLIRDTFGDIWGENFASSGWRNSSVFFGPANSFAASYNGYIPELSNNGYLWSYGSGGGSFTSCDGVAGSDDFALNNIKTVFTGFIGSYFGDWNTESSFLRAPLGSGYCLTVMWDGRPHWWLHHMALGETIGYSTRVSQNNVAGGLYSTQNWGTHRIHMALMGDPTLRLHPVIPPANLSATSSTGVSLNWTASSDSAIQGYLVYRGNSLNGPFTKISGSALLSKTRFTDPSGTPGNIYMVRAVKLEQSASGTYFNPSVGAFIQAAPASVPAPAAPSNLTGTGLSDSSIRLQWSDNSLNETGFNLLRRVGGASTYTTINLPANTTSYTDSNLAAGTQYFYKIDALNAGGPSSYSAEISVTTAPPVQSSPTVARSSFLGIDSTRQGNWKGVIGTEAYSIPTDAQVLPPSIVLSATGKSDWIWEYATADVRGLQRATIINREAACAYGSSFSYDLNLTDGRTHAVSLYCLDWDHGNRVEAVEILDASSKTVLHTFSLSSFNNGLYLNYAIKGHVLIRVTAQLGANAVVSGIFVDPSATQL
jgi:hypothetical protein